MSGDDLYIDTHQGSRKAPPSVWDAMDGGLQTDGAMRRAAELRKDIDQVEKHVRRLFERVQESQAECEQHGIRLDYRLAELLSAAYGAYMVGRDRPTRIDLAQVSEAPIGPKP